jgi:hypothetical protein
LVVMSLFFLCCMISFDPAMLLGKAPSATNMLAAGAGTLLGGLRRQAAAKNDTGAS